MVRWGLRPLRRAPLVWGGGVGALCALMAAMWPSIEDSMADLMQSYPENLRKAFGIEELTTVEAYVDAEMLSLVIPFVLGFFAIRSVERAVVGAEDRGHLDVLLALPLRRAVLLVGAWLAAGAALAGVLAVAWALTWLVGTAAGTGISAVTMAAGFAGVWPLAMCFAGLAALVSGLAHRPAVVTGVAFGTLAAMYTVDLVGRLSEPVEPLRWASAFRWYGSAVHDGIDPLHVLLLSGAGLAMVLVGALLFERRDVL
jgi:ABC-2 type transport system permease protein